MAKRLQAEFDEEVCAKEERASAVCPICFDKLPFGKMVALDCDHRYCHECLAGFVEMNIREMRVTSKELVCQWRDPHCDMEITCFQVEGLIKEKNNELWNKYLDTAAKLWRPSGDDHYCLCPDPKCSNRFLAEAEIRLAQCPVCRLEFCAPCGNLPHPAMTCEENKQFVKDSDENEQALQELIKKEKWQRCPVCKAPCDRDTGCNYMTCYSSECRGSTNFCYICGDKLSMLDHVLHFPWGPHAAACRKVEPEDEALRNQPIYNRFGHEIRAVINDWWNERQP